MTRARMAWSGAAAAIVLLAWVAPARAALECGDTISSDKKLRADLDCPLDSNGLSINGDGVTLDLNGHTISAAPQMDNAALQVEGSVGVRVLNGKLRGFNIGLNVVNSEDVTAKGLDIRKAEGRGVYVIGANHVRLQNGAVRGPSVTGMDIQPTTDHIKITGNELRGVGIDIQGQDQKVARQRDDRPRPARCLRDRGRRQRGRAQPDLRRHGRGRDRARHRRQ